MDVRRSATASPATLPAAPAPTVSRRYRVPIPNLVYLNVDEANGGIIRNLNESGLAIQAMTPLLPDQRILLRFTLSNPRMRVAATGRVVWAGPAGEAGVELLDLPAGVQRLLKQWIVAQLLDEADRTAGVWNFVCEDNREDAPELLMSSVTRPTIYLPAIPRDSACSARHSSPGNFQFVWLAGKISPVVAAGLVDALIVLSAVLLFAIICMAMIHLAPAWPLTLATAVVVSAIFSGLYWWLSRLGIGGTPGSRLTGLAPRVRHSSPEPAADQPRFR